MQLDIPDELATRIRQHAADASIAGHDRCLDCTLAALLPEPDPLDVLAQKDGWERIDDRYGTHLYWHGTQDDVSVRLWRRDDGYAPRVEALAGSSLEMFAASACALAERIVEAIREAQ